jgi:hypothetical protein
MSPTVPEEPLARLTNGTPVVYRALGAVLHLEPLLAEDEGALDEVNDLVWEWFGDKLAHTTLSCADRPEPARRAHLDYIANFCANLDVAELPSGTANDQRIAANLVQFAINETSVVCSGARDPFEASPFSYRFWAEIAPHEEDADALHLPALGVLHLTVPEDWPLADFHQRVTTLASKLRLRWGAAGLTFSACEAQNYQRPNEAIFAHARRFSGYDVAEYVLLAKAFYDRLRTVSWLTWLGPSMLEDLRLRGGLGGSRLSTQTAFGDGVLLQAGGAPEAGDVNRRQLPAAYREVDALVRAMRASRGKGLAFFPPWEEASIEHWLRRFELQ